MHGLSRGHVTCAPAWHQAWEGAALPPVLLACPFSPTSEQRFCTATFSQPAHATPAGNSRDILFRNVSVQSHVNHAMGADGRAIMSVFEGSRMRIGTVEMHR